MASKFFSPFVGPLTALDAWLGQVDDTFAIYDATKSEEAPDLDVRTKIRLTGTRLQEPSTASWWSAGRTEFLKLKSWELFETRIRERFMPKGYKLIALRSFFLCSQGELQFSEYAAQLAEAQNAVGSATITATMYKYQLLFHSHNILLLRIMALPDFDVDKISFDNLVSLLSMQWESITAEGLNHPSSRAIPPSLSAPTNASTTSLGHTPQTLLSEWEREQLSAAQGCWRCRKVPTDPGWTSHVVRTCPGDPAQCISLGRDYVPPVEDDDNKPVFRRRRD